MTLLHGLVAAGTNGEPWWIALIKAGIVINLVLVTFAYLTLAERKVMGRMQLRYGPNRAGPYGLLQPIADLVKLIRKESFFPAAAVDILYITAPFLAAFTALLTFSVIPWGPGWVIGGYQVNGYVADLPIAHEAGCPRGDVALVLNRGFAGTNSAVLVRAARQI